MFGTIAQRFLPIVFTHGGCVEAAVHEFSGADDHDLSEGEVAVVEDEDGTYFVRFI